MKTYFRGTEPFRKVREMPALSSASGTMFDSRVWGGITQPETTEQAGTQSPDKKLELPKELRRLPNLAEVPVTSNTCQ
jgi:hypothetical protein